MNVTDNINTDYLTTPEQEITLGEAAGMIIELRDHIAQSNAAMQAALAQVTALKDKLATAVAIQDASGAFPVPSKVQVLHRRPEGNAAMQIINVDNDGQVLTVTVQ